MMLNVFQKMYQAGGSVRTLFSSEEDFCETFDLDGVSVDSDIHFSRPPRLIPKHKSLYDRGWEGRIPSSKVRMTVDPDSLADFQYDVDSVLSKPLQHYFNDPWGVYNAFRNSIPARDLISSNQMSWNQAVMVIATHINSGRPLEKVICYADSTTPKKLKCYDCEERKECNEDNDMDLEKEPFKKLIISIKGVKVAPADMYERPTPIILVSFSYGKSLESLDIPSKEGSHLSLYFTQDEWQYLQDQLMENNCYVSKTYKVKTNSAEHVQASFIRPPLRPEFPAEEEKKRKIEEKKKRKLSREAKRIAIMEQKKSREIAKQQMIKMKIQPNEREASNTICAWTECEKPVMFTCGSCKSSHYCCREHQQRHWRKHHQYRCELFRLEYLSLKKKAEGGTAPTAAAPTATVAHPPAKAAPVEGPKAKIPDQSLKSVPPVVSEGQAPPFPAEMTRKPDGPPRPPGSGTFDPMRDVHPSSVGPGSKAPEDIWHTKTGGDFICIDLKMLGDEVPVSNHEEHALFWIRIQIPFLGNGTQLLVDQAGTLKLNMTEKKEGYFAIKKCIQKDGWKNLKGFFPARRHGDFVRIYLSEIDANQTW